MAHIVEEHFHPSQRNWWAFRNHLSYETNQELVSVNIYSHLFGSLLFCLLALYTFHKVYSGQSSAGVVDVVVFAVFFFGVAVCFLLSATYTTSTPATVSVANTEIVFIFSLATALASLRWAINLITLELYF